MQEEDIIGGRDDAGGHYRSEGQWSRRTLQKGGMMQEEDIIEGRDDARGHYRREG